MTKRLLPLLAALAVAAGVISACTPTNGASSTLPYPGRTLLDVTPSPPDSGGGMPGK